MKIILFISLICTSFSNVSKQKIDLDKSQWIGLGFFLAPYEAKKTPKYYKHCYSNERFFLKLPYINYHHKILSAVKWHKNTLELKAQNGESIYCKESKNKIIEELIFYKDLLHAKKEYSTSTFWTKQNFMYVYDKQKNIKKYKTPRFQALKVYKIDLAPVHKNHSIRIHLKTQKGLPGFFDIAYTGVNRIGDIEGLSEYFFLQNPKIVFGMNNDIFQNVINKKVVIGMTIEQVLLTLGKPEKFYTNNDNTTLLYYDKLKDNEIEYHFYKKRLTNVVDIADDEWNNDQFGEL